MNETSPAWLADPRPASAKSRLRVGIVDDDGHFLESVSFALEFSGFKVEPFLDGKRLLQADITSRLDCLVVDWIMPESDGPSLHRELRAAGIRTPVIFCTGLSPDDIKESGFNVSGLQIVRKPVRTAELERAIRTACS